MTHEGGRGFRFVGAITAIARKIAIIFYTMVKKQVEYDETIWAITISNASKGSSTGSSAKPDNSAISSCPCRPNLLRKEPHQKRCCSSEEPNAGVGPSEGIL